MTELSVDPRSDLPTRMWAADSGEGSVREGDIELGEIVNSDGLLGGNLSGLTGPRTVSHSCFEKEVAERATWSRHGYQRHKLSDAGLPDRS